MNDSIYPCDYCDQIFNSYVYLRAHRLFDHRSYCEKCDSYLWDGQVFNDHIAQEHKFQCNKCWRKFAEKDELELHNVEMICDLDLRLCEECHDIFEDKFQLKDNKDKYHESSLEPPAAADGDKCEDEVDSKASVEKDHTR